MIVPGWIDRGSRRLLCGARTCEGGARRDATDRLTKICPRVESVFARAGSRAGGVGFISPTV